MGGGTMGVRPLPIARIDPVRGGTGGTVLEGTRPEWEADNDPVLVMRGLLRFEREGLTDPVMGCRVLWLPLMDRASFPLLSVGNRLVISWASWVGWKRAACTMSSSASAISEPFW